MYLSVSAAICLIGSHLYWWGGRQIRVGTDHPGKKVVVAGVALTLLARLLYLRPSILHLLPALYVADVLVALVHFVGDFFHMGQFIRHHEAPRYMTDKTYVHHTFRTYVLALLVLPLFWDSSFALLSLLLAIQGNELHVWAHCDPAERPHLIRWLQRAHLIITPERHRIHHTGDHDRSYGTLNGWSHELLNPITIWVTRWAQPWQRPVWLSRRG